MRQLVPIHVTQTPGGKVANWQVKNRGTRSAIRSPRALLLSIGTLCQYNAAVMDSAFLNPVEVLHADADLAPVLVRLVAEMDQLHAEMAQLRRDNLQLRQQAGYWQSRHADAVRRLATVQRDNEQLRGE